MDLSCSVPYWVMQCFFDGPPMLYDSLRERVCSYAKFLSPFAKWFRYSVVGDHWVVSGDNRFRKCSFRGPSQLSEAIFDRKTVDACSCRPLSDCKGLALKCYAMVCACIVMLFANRGPAAVLRTVIAFNVYAVKAVTFCWRITDITSKRLERVSPFIAHCYSAATVVLVRGTRTISASLNHSLPRFIQFATTSTVGGFGVRCCLRLKTSATFCIAGPKRTGRSVMAVTAIALAKPGPLEFAVNQTHFAPNCSEISERLTG